MKNVEVTLPSRKLMQSWSLLLKPQEEGKKNTTHTETGTFPLKKNYLQQDKTNKLREILLKGSICLLGD